MPQNQRYNDMSEKDNWKSISKKAAYATAIGSVGAYLIFDERGESSFLNMQVPSAVAAGLGAGVGSVAGDLLTDWVIEKFDQTSSIKNVESTAVKLMVSGAGTVGALKYASGIPMSVEGFALGAGSKFAGDAVYLEVDPLAMLF
jgi:hypothetical protein